MALSQVAGFPVGSYSTGLSTQVVTVGAIGDLLLLSVASDQGFAVASISGAGGTWARVGPRIFEPAATHSAELWWAIAGVSGSQTITVTWTATIAGGVELWAESWTAGLGSQTQWGVSAYGVINSASTTTIVFPSLTSGAQPLQGYWGYALIEAAQSSGSTTGFTYDQTTVALNEDCHNVSLAANTLYAPTCPTTLGGYAALGAIFFATPGPTVALTGVRASGAGVQVDGVPGSTKRSRFMGGMISGPPVSGTFDVGDYVIDSTGMAWICILAGTPGQWTAAKNYASRMFARTNFR